MHCSCGSPLPLLRVFISPEGVAPNCTGLPAPVQSFTTSDEATRPEHGFPLVVLQPGIGGIGKKSTGENIWLTDTYREHFPAYVVYLHPQSRTHEYITRDDGINNGRPTEMIDYYIKGIEHLVDTIPEIDRQRIYLTGHSMGGSSTWYIMLARPDLAAAAVPLAGIPPIDLDEAERLKDIPIWMMMGNNDPWSGSYPYVRTYQNLVQEGAERVRFWEIQDIGHSGRPQNLWPIAEFLFSFRRGETNSGTTHTPTLSYNEATARSWTNQEGRQITAGFVHYHGETVELILPDQSSVHVPLDTLIPADREWIRETTGYRLWQNQQGQTIEARLVSRDGDQVKLERLDGQTFRIPLATLSEPDQAFLREKD
ncbi:MAG: prolyl oligopeptidase family serine peptidase [Opitutales bacterium]|nr:prolyl oligopeptidase family serine peptidase [Opitutales bacterium]